MTRLLGTSEPSRHVFRGRGDGLVFLGLVVLLFIFPLARGGNRLWAVSLFDAMVFGLCALWLLCFIFGRVQMPAAVSRARYVIFLWLLWLAYIAFQFVPLPLPLAETLAPLSVEKYAAVAAVTGEPLHAAAISISRGDTFDHLLESTGLLALFLLVLFTVRGNRRMHFLAMTLVCGGLFQALYGILFYLSGLDRGLFLDAASPLNVVTGTFVNRNHLAGYLEIAAAAGIGLVLADLKGGGASNWRARFRHFVEFLMSETVLLRVFLAIMVIALVMSQSRMGNVAFFSSIGVAGMIYVVLRERQLFFKSLFVFATLFLIDFLILSNWFGLDALVERIETTEMSREMRVAVMPDLLRAFEAYWPMGSGLGSFYTAFPEFRSPEIPKLHYHAHNDYIEFGIETGIWGLALLGGIVALVMWRAVLLLVKRKDRLVGGIAFAAIMAVVALGIHGTVDFNLQIPANAAALVALLGLVMSCSPEGRRHSNGGRQA
ncbi:MAG: hypothetical protein CMN84_09275 [Spongiibacteraceae bacterium]|jgi:O-antigen ligase|nr:hypothetical protein [Spongiibacteraceae bacterium]